MTAIETVRAAGAMGGFSRTGVGVAYQFIVYGPRSAVTRAVLALGFGFDAGRRPLVTELHAAEPHPETGGTFAGTLVTTEDRASATIGVGALARSGYEVA
jgi:hypothetical protein